MNIMSSLYLPHYNSERVKYSEPLNLSLCATYVHELEKSKSDTLNFIISCAT
jgi:hypothetical protein